MPRPPPGSEGGWAVDSRTVLCWTFTMGITSGHAVITGRVSAHRARAGNALNRPEKEKITSRSRGPGQKLVLSAVAGAEPGLV